jgi:hypothetical protein
MVFKPRFRAIGGRQGLKNRIVVFYSSVAAKQVAGIVIGAGDALP